MRYVLCLLVLMPVSSLADRFQTASDYADALRDATSKRVCIAMAEVRADAVRTHIAGRCQADSLFQIGSITKTFTGVFLAEAVLNETLALETPIDELIEGGAPDYAGQSITLLDLATHFSGLPRLPTNIDLNEAAQDDPYARYGRQELNEFLNTYTLPRAPGAQMEYSNLGMGLLGDLLARQSGMSYEDLIRSVISEPLEMSDTVITPDRKQSRRRTQGLGYDYKPVPDWRFDALAGAGALYSTLDDMVRYAKVNLDASQSPLGSSLAFAHMSRRPVAEMGGHIGLGFFIRGAGLWHNGQTAGHKSFFGFIPEQEHAVVVLANAPLETLDLIGAHVLEGVALPPIEAETNSGPYAEFIGEFVMSPQFAIEITTNGKRLFGQATRQPKFGTRETGIDQFQIVGVEAQITFNRNDAGEIVSLTLFQNGQRQIARKKGVVIEREVIELPATHLDRLVGTYQLAPGVTLTISRRGSQILAQVTGQPAVPVYPRSPTRFYYEVVVAEIEFELGAEGVATSLILHQNGQHHAKRVE
ncbi:MAG: serine hydrolase [Pseudomonadota bacterium]